MRRIAFNVTLIVSLGMLALLSLGFVGRIGVLIRQGSQAATMPYRERTIIVASGRFMIWTETWPVQPLGTRTFEPVVQFTLRFPRISRQALVGFDAHLDDAPKFSAESLYLFACPIWALALPFLIAPTIWLRRPLAERRRKRLQHGFPVNSIEPEPQPQ